MHRGEEEEISPPPQPGQSCQEAGPSRAREGSREKGSSKWNALLQTASGEREGSSTLSGPPPPSPEQSSPVRVERVEPEGQQQGPILRQQLTQPPQSAPLNFSLPTLMRLPVSRPQETRASVTVTPISPVMPFSPPQLPPPLPQLPPMHMHPTVYPNMMHHHHPPPLPPPLPPPPPPPPPMPVPPPVPPHGGVLMSRHAAMTMAVGELNRIFADAYSGASDAMRTCVHRPPWMAPQPEGERRKLVFFPPMSPHHALFSSRKPAVFDFWLKGVLQDLAETDKAVAAVAALFELPNARLVHIVEVKPTSGGRDPRRDAMHDLHLRITMEFRYAELVNDDKYRELDSFYEFNAMVAGFEAGNYALLLASRLGIFPGEERKLDYATIRHPSFTLVYCDLPHSGTARVAQFNRLTKALLYF